MDRTGPAVVLEGPEDVVTLELVVFIILTKVSYTTLHFRRKEVAGDVVAEDAHLICIRRLYALAEVENGPAFLVIFIESTG